MKDQSFRFDGQLLIVQYLREMNGPFFRDDTLGSAAVLVLGIVTKYFVVAASKSVFCSKASRPRCIWVTVCQVIQSLSYSNSSSFKLSLQSQSEDSRQSKLSGLWLSMTHSLFAFFSWFLFFFCARSLSLLLLSLLQSNVHTVWPLNWDTALNASKSNATLAKFRGDIVAKKTTNVQKLRETHNIRASMLL